MEGRSGGECIGAILLIAIVGRSDCSFTHTYPHQKIKRIVRFKPFEERICLISSNR
jgi:hypothetical protein